MISKLKQHKTVNRPLSLGGSQRTYQEIEFEIPYNPTIKNRTVRLLAKLIDFGLICLPLYWFLPKQLFVDYFLIFFVLFFPVFAIFNACQEMYFGTTIGKAIFGLMVVNDDANNLNWKESIQKNLVYWLTIPPFGNLANTIDWYEQLLQDRKIYIIKKSKKKEILARIQEYNLQNQF